jgi:hypothetical protein
MGIDALLLERVNLRFRRCAADHQTPRQQRTEQYPRMANHPPLTMGGRFFHTSAVRFCGAAHRWQLSGKPERPITGQGGGKRSTFCS